MKEEINKEIENQEIILEDKINLINDLGNNIKNYKDNIKNKIKNFIKEKDDNKNIIKK